MPKGTTEETGVNRDQRMSTVESDVSQVVELGRDRIIKMKASPRTPLAIGSALVTFLVVMVLGAGFWMALGLSAVVFSGVWLLVKEPAPEPLMPEEIAYARARAKLKEMQDSIGNIPKSSMRKCVTKLTDEIARMLDAIESDRDRGSMIVAPVYESKLVEPFSALLKQTLWLVERKVKGAEKYVDYIDTTVCPKTLYAADEFYQQYHQQDVLDLAALSEILEETVDTITAASANGFDDDDFE